MNAADTIRAAIERLEQARDAASAGRWVVHAPWPGSFPTGIVAANSVEVADALEPFDSALIVTLHRTINAQLAILRAARGWAADTDAGAIPDEPWAGRGALYLARAILGEDQ